MVPWYVLVGRRVLYCDQPDDRLGIVYLAVLLGLLAVAQSFAGTNIYVLLALCPQCFMAVSTAAR